MQKSIFINYKFKYYIYNKIEYNKIPLLKKKLNNLFLFSLLAYIGIINCVLEIPLKPIKVNSIPKYKNIKFNEFNFSLIKNKFLNKTKTFISKGDIIINENVLYYTTVKIGSKKQEFNLLLDTGSQIIWVARIGSNDSYPIKNHFDPTSSTSCKETKLSFKMKYGSGNCTGYYYKDYFNYINNKDFQIYFGVANQTYFDVDDMDGIIGLGHYYNNKTLSFINMLKSSGVTDSLSFSFKFGNTVNENSNGNLYIGRHEDFSSSNTANCPLVTSGNYIFYWVCQVDGLSIKNSNIEIKSKRKYNIIFDTGSNFIILPLEYINDLKDDLYKLGCEVASDLNVNMILICPKNNNLPDFKLTINGYILTLSSKYTFFENKKYPNILFSYIIFQKTDYYIIGSPFFCAFHTLFDQEKDQLQFYSENKEYIEKEINWTLIIILIIISVIICIIIIYLVYNCIKKRKSKEKKEEEALFPSSDYKNNLIN